MPPASAPSRHQTNRIIRRPKYPWSISGSEFEIDHAVHCENSDTHPKPRHREHLPGQIFVPDGPVEIRRNNMDSKEYEEGQRSQDDRRGTAFCSKSADFAPHLESLAYDTRKVLQNFTQ